jgi:hypothetical protein
MAARNGIHVSSVPFELRYRAPDPRRRCERLTGTDRLSCAGFVALLGLVL